MLELDPTREGDLGMGLRAKTANSCNAKIVNSNSSGKLRPSTSNVPSQNSQSMATSTINTSVNAMYRRCSNSTMVSSCIRPQTLEVEKQRTTLTEQAQSFFGEVLNVWRKKARCNVVPAERTLELFHELSFNPSDKQIGEMLQTAKCLARKSRCHSSGLTFGEFCVLAADMKRFRMSSFASTGISDKTKFLSSLEDNSSVGAELRTAKPVNRSRNFAKNRPDISAPVEVFLGGSCNPTTWRADVAIPALQKLGISFYNPQVSEWTPDLIELEHRAKEKARVLFFVMDSETRASAGAIEAAYIAGLSCKQLVLVLHSYKQNQSISNERISREEYIDLTRNQLILKELVTRRGLPVLDNIPSGLQRTKEILAGIIDPPLNIASILVVIRGAFDRVGPISDMISIEQCQQALSYLGYAHSLLSIEDLTKIVTSQKQSLISLGLKNTQNKQLDADCNNSESTIASTNGTKPSIHFELFCVVSAYLSVLQQEIHESGCVSPIKGTNVPPPPVYLVNMQADEGFTNSSYCNANNSRHSIGTKTSRSNEIPHHNRDSGSSSPQLIDTQVERKTISPVQTGKVSVVAEESDSNDSVFSSSSSISSVNYNSDALTVFNLDFRDVYLGGSCFKRTTWRQEIAMPYLQAKGVSFHLPALHESILPSRLDLPGIVFDKSSNTFYIKSASTQIRSSGQTTMAAEELFSSELPFLKRKNLFNPSLLDSSRVLLFVITKETRSLAPMTLAAHCIGLMYNVVLVVQMLPDDCVIGQEKLTHNAIKDYNRGRSYLIDLAKRQGVPVFSEIMPALECTVEKVMAHNSRIIQDV